MRRDFGRHERQLVGVKGGLEWFYEPLARLSDEEVDERAEQGDKLAKRRQRKREKVSRRGFDDPTDYHAK